MATQQPRFTLHLSDWLALYNTLVSDRTSPSAYGRVNTYQANFLQPTGAVFSMVMIGSTAEDMGGGGE